MRGLLVWAAVHTSPQPRKKQGLAGLAEQALVFNSVLLLVPFSVCIWWPWAVRDSGRIRGTLDVGTDCL